MTRQAKSAAERAREYRARRANAGMESRHEDGRIAVLEARIAELTGALADLAAAFRDLVIVVTSRDVTNRHEPSQRDVTIAPLARTQDLNLFSSSLEKSERNPPLTSFAPPTVTNRHEPSQRDVTKPKTTPRGTPCPPSGAEPGEVMGWRQAAGIPAELLREAEQEFGHFLDHHRARRSLFVDWGAAWRTWQRNAVKFSPSPSGPRLRQMPERPLTRDGDDPSSYEASRKRAKAREAELFEQLQQRLKEGSG